MENSSQTNSFSYVDSRVDGSSSGYGVVDFECGVKELTGNMISLCMNFMGFNAGLKGGSGAFSMRYVNFLSSSSSSSSFSQQSASFHSQIQPDQRLLDFVVAFSQAKVLQKGVLSTFSVFSAQLINAYTLVNAKLPNVKVSYVNFFMQNGGALETNNGVKIPTMLRIGGSISFTDEEPLHI